MRPVTTAPLSAIGVTPPVVLDYRNSVQPTTLAVQLSAGGAATAKVQYTVDDVFDPAFNPATANWFDLAGFTGLVASTIGNIQQPYTAVRLSVTAYTSGSVSLKVISNNGLLG